MKRHFDRIHCTGCGNCIRFCPKGILKLSEEPDEQGIYITVIDEKACISCRSCETMCTRGAFWFSDTDQMPEEFLTLIDREEPVEKVVCDYIAGMTDQYSIMVYEELYVPAAWKVY